MKNITLLIGGMTCGGCAKSIDKKLKEITGVSEVTVDLAQNQAVITFDESLTQSDALIEVIEDAGFDASLA